MDLLSGQKDGIPKPTVQLKKDNFRAYEVKTVATLRAMEWLDLVRGIEKCPEAAAGPLSTVAPPAPS